MQHHSHFWQSDVALDESCRDCGHSWDSAAASQPCKGPAVYTGWMLESDLAYANARGVGQYHLCHNDGRYARMTFRSFAVAMGAASRNRLEVANDSGELVGKLESGL